MEPSESWPQPPSSLSDASAPEERVITLNTYTTVSPTLDVLDRFSSWRRLTRVMSFVIRWSPRYKRSTIPDWPTFSTVLASGKVCEIPVVVPDEIQATTTRILTLVQASVFPTELELLRQERPLPKASPLLNLTPMFDRDGLLRVGGRLQHSTLDNAAKHPVILRAHPITRLIALDAHHRCLHGGVTLTLSTLRSTVWIIHAKKLIKSIIFHSVDCTRLKADTATQLMGILPIPRVCRSARPFEHCGLDYMGPLQV